MLNSAEVASVVPLSAPRVRTVSATLAPLRWTAKGVSAADADGQRAVPLTVMIPTSAVIRPPTASSWTSLPSALTARGGCAGAGAPTADLPF